MKRGCSYIGFTDTEKPNHRLVKALHDKGIRGFELIYASHWSTHAGWTFNHTEAIANSVFLPIDWLGFTIDEAVKNIDKLTVKCVNEEKKAVWDAR